MVKKILISAVLACVLAVGASYFQSSHSVASDHDMIPNSVHRTQISQGFTYSPMSDHDMIPN